MSFAAMNPSLGYPPIAEFIDVSSTDAYLKPPPYGTIITATDPVYGAGEFIFLKGVASTVVGSWVVYNSDDFSSTLLVADLIGPVAVAMSACVANKAGWYQINGKAVALTSAAVADNANVYTTATPGAVDDTIVAGERVQNAKCASTIASATTGDFEIARPWVLNGLAD